MDGTSCIVREFLVPYPLKNWYYRHVLPQFMGLGGIEPRASLTLAKLSVDWPTSPIFDLQKTIGVIFQDLCQLGFVHYFLVTWPRRKCLGLDVMVCFPWALLGEVLLSGVSIVLLGWGGGSSVLLGEGTVLGDQKIWVFFPFFSIKPFCFFIRGWKFWGERKRSVHGFKYYSVVLSPQNLLK